MVVSPSDAESEEWESGSEGDSDRELQAAFRRGLLQPGLNVLKARPARAPAANRRADLKRRLKELQELFPQAWAERLNVSSPPAPLNPEMALQIEEHRQRRVARMQAKGRKAGAKAAGSEKEPQEPDLVHDDFRREMTFYRQAQAAVLKALPELRRLGLPTRRPEDYFAQMLKTDDHMQKVRRVLMEKQAGAERAEKVRRLRQAKKMAKEVQLAARQQKNKDKKNLLEQVKRYQRGQVDNLDFLEEDSGKKKGTSVQGRGKGGARGQREQQPLTKKQRRVQQKRQRKEERYGFGGQKKRSKWNTQESASDVRDYRPSPKPGQRRPRAKPAAQRPGKERRQKMQSRASSAGKKGRR